jgi:putative addiction module component (TIGR02574 family)
MIDLEDIKKLSVEERIEMVEAIWNSIEEDTIGKQLPVSAEQQEEIERRLDRYERGESKLYTWDEVIEGIKGKR